MHVGANPQHGIRAQSQEVERSHTTAHLDRFKEPLDGGDGTGRHYWAFGHSSFKIAGVAAVLVRQLSAMSGIDALTISLQQEIRVPIVHGRVDTPGTGGLC